MPLQDIVDYLSYASPLILFTGIVVSLFLYRRLDNTFKTVCLYLMVSLIIDIVSRYITNYSELKNNLFLLPFFSFLELTLFSHIYYNLMLNTKNRFLKAFIILALLAILADIIFIDIYNSENFQSYGKVLDNLCIMFFCLLFIWQLIKGTKKFKPELVALNYGILFYFSVNLLIWLPANFLVNEKSGIVFFFWMINLLFTVLFYSFLIYLIWKNGKTPKH